MAHDTMTPEQEMALAMVESEVEQLSCDILSLAAKIESLTRKTAMSVKETSYEVTDR